MLFDIILPLAPTVMCVCECDILFFGCAIRRHFPFVCASQRERDEALQGMAHAQVLLIPALLGSILDQMSDDMFPLHFI